MLCELCWAWCCDQFPGGPVQGFEHPLNKEPFSDTQPKPSLTEFHAVSSGSISGHEGEEINV